MYCICQAGVSLRCGVTLCYAMYHTATSEKACGASSLLQNSQSSAAARTKLSSEQTLRAMTVTSGLSENLVGIRRLEARSLYDSCWNTWQSSLRLLRPQPADETLIPTGTSSTMSNRWFWHRELENSNAAAFQKVYFRFVSSKPARGARRQNPTVVISAACQESVTMSMLNVAKRVNLKVMHSVTTIVTTITQGARCAAVTTQF